MLGRAARDPAAMLWSWVVGVSGITAPALFGCLQLASPACTARRHVSKNHCGPCRQSWGWWTAMLEGSCGPAQPCHRDRGGCSGQAGPGADRRQGGGAGFQPPPAGFGRQLRQLHPPGEQLPKSLAPRASLSLKGGCCNARGEQPLQERGKVWLDMVAYMLLSLHAKQGQLHTASAVSDLGVCTAMVQKDSGQPECRGWRKGEGGYARTQVHGDDATESEWAYVQGQR